MFGKKQKIVNISPKYVRRVKGRLPMIGNEPRVVVCDLKSISMITGRLLFLQSKPEISMVNFLVRTTRSCGPVEKEIKCK